MSSSVDLDDYEQKVLQGWEAIYKRGLLTMWCCWPFEVNRDAP
ncbi:hypothetical protein BH24ACT15_BH24ACT15_29040 [soil metagenome]|jgi:hypothetical protein